MSGGMLGCLSTPAQGSRVPDGCVWAADTGCYTSRRYCGDQRWLQWLAGHPGDRSRCLFATAPDMVGDAAATLDRSRPWLPAIRDLGYRAALVAQEGLEHLPVPWDEFDVLFIGGASTEWKLGPAATQLARHAVAHGKRVHLGRVNSLRRLRHAVRIGATSADGTYLTYAPDTNLTRCLRWLDHIHTGDSPSTQDGDQ